MNDASAPTAPGVGLFSSLVRISAYIAPAASRRYAVALTVMLDAACPSVNLSAPTYPVAPQAMVFLLDQAEPLSAAPFDQFLKPLMLADGIYPTSSVFPASASSSLRHQQKTSGGPFTEPVAR